MTQSSCKRDTKSKSYLSMKLASVRVFSCKHPLTEGFHNSGKLFFIFISILVATKLRKVKEILTFLQTSFVQ